MRARERYRSERTTSGDRGTGEGKAGVGGKAGWKRGKRGKRASKSMKSRRDGISDTNKRHSPAQNSRAKLPSQKHPEPSPNLSCIFKNPGSQDDDEYYGGVGDLRRSHAEITETGAVSNYRLICEISFYYCNDYLFNTDVHVISTGIAAYVLF
ncbi:hypothetical protein chiPu_0005385 [Chiloscyllium punctatum]|uniref:Uncharacterized protein n=1 Tax=Chiloscyllium punctatum TaxID=137246 RepID=A0A401S987_CHIPU|nr:hypothetical protein [Chiloscyllium punctatum]